MFSINRLEVFEYLLDSCNMIGKLYDHYEQLTSPCKAVHIIVEFSEFLGRSAVLHRCGLLLQRERHGVSVFHDREPCKND